MGDVHLSLGFIVPEKGGSERGEGSTSEAKFKRLTITMMGRDAIWLHYFGALC